MNLQDLLDGKLVEDENRSDTETFNKVLFLLQEKGLFKENFINILPDLYSQTDFWITLEEILTDLDKEPNRTYINYSLENNEFVSITKEKEGDFLSLKRNSHTVFILLVLGFSKKEIMSILKVSRSYISLIMKTIKVRSSVLLEFSSEVCYPSFKLF